MSDDPVTVELPAELDFDDLPVGKDGLWAWAHAVANGRPARLELAGQQRDLLEVAKTFGLMSRVFELAAAAGNLGDTPQDMAQAVGEQVEDPVVLAAHRGDAVLCTACGNLWDAGPWATVDVTCSCGKRWTRRMAAMEAEAALGIRGRITVENEEVQAAAPGAVRRGEFDGPDGDGKLGAWW